ncbi:unnamed protein product [Rotaria sp. Silwood2]|nr:unnamed protein product [Rotaria sp. Silwood2]
MSSSTSDSFLTTPLSNKVTGYVSYIQKKKYFTEQRVHSMRQFFFRFVGVSVILYFIFQLLLLFNFLLKLIFRLLFQIFSIIILLLSKFIQLLLPKTTNYNILFFFIGFCSILSFFIAKFSHKNIEIHLGKRYKLIKRYSFMFTFITLLLLQSVLILLPTTASIQEQRKLSSTPVLFKEAVIKLSEQKIVGTTVQDNAFTNDLKKIKRELNDRKREEHNSINGGIKTNENGKTPDGKQMINLDIELSSSLGKDSEIESNVEDDHSYLINHANQDISTDEKSTVYLRNKISPGEAVFKQKGNNQADSAKEISSNILEKSSKFIQEKPKQIKEFLSDILKEEKDGIVIFHQKLNNWLDEAWNIWHQTKLDFQNLFSLTTKHTQHLPRYNVSSIYTAYTDLNCYDYTKTTYDYFLPKQKYIYFLNTYRRYSPFPVYLSILKSNGPKCYRHYPNSSCAVNSKLIFSNLKENLYRFAKFSIIICLPIIILLIISKNLKYGQYHKKNEQLSNENQQIMSNKTDNLSLQQTSAIINNNNNNINYVLDEKIEKELHSWLEYEQNDGYQNLSEACRIALNKTFSKNNEQLNIETLQFSNAKIHDVSQASVETIVIHAVLDIVHLIFNIVNIAKCQHYSIEIPKLTGNLEIFLTSSTNKYSIEVKFKQIEIDNAEIIDSKNILSSDDKESIIKLFKEIIRQTVVQLCCHLSSDHQENIVNESKIVTSKEPSIQQISPEPSQVYQPYEIPLLPTISENNQELLPEKEAKKLLVRIVKAVKLHDVEQPFCIVELNQPKQIHQTSIAKNGLNPFWDEAFLFDSNDKSNQIRLKIIDRKKPNKKHNNHIIDKIYADVSIPFSYITSTNYKQDVRITPLHPDSIIRIETNLNRIFIDLCTSPEVRNKFGHQRNKQLQHNPPLPSLKPIKSNSCSNIDELSQHIESSLSIENNQKEQIDTLDLINTATLPILENPSNEPSHSTAASLVPMESTGFAVQTTSFPNHHSLTLFETLAICHFKKPSLQRETSNESKIKVSLSPSNASTASRDWKQQDFINRLQNQANNIQHGYQRSPSDEIIALPYNGNPLFKDNTYANNALNIASNISRPTTIDLATSACSTLSSITSYTDDNQLDKPRKSRSLMSSFRNSILHRRKKHHKKDQQNENAAISALNTTVETSVIPHSVSAEPCLSKVI